MDGAPTGRSADECSTMHDVNEKLYNLNNRLHEVEELCSLQRNDFFNSVADVDRACTQRIESLKKFFLE